MASTRIEDVTAEQRSQSKSFTVIKLISVLIVLSAAFLGAMYGISLMIS